jgi:vacuolar-type H+-ATPase subunit I/STV1
MAWNKLKSLFVQSDSSKASDATLAELEEKYQLPADAAGAVDLTAAATPVAAGELDFQALYDQAGIPNTDEVEALERFLQGLDDTLPQTSKQAAAKAFLGAIGKSPADVLKDAARKITVVRTVADAKRADVEKAAGEQQALIADLQRQIDEHRAAVENLRRDLEAVKAKCAAEEGRLQGARVFFGAVGEVKPGPG